MLEVPIDKILSITDARNSFNKIVEDVESAQDGIYILTKGGSPVVALINIKYLEKLAGETLATKEEKSMQTEGQPQPETPSVPGTPSTPPPAGAESDSAGGPTPPSPTPPPPAPGPQPPTSPSPTPEPALPSTGEGELPGPNPSPSPIPPVAGPTPPAGQPWGQQ